MSERKPREKVIVPVVMITDSFKLKIEKRQYILEQLRTTEKGEQVWEFAGYYTTDIEPIKKVLRLMKANKVSKKGMATLTEYLQFAKGSHNEIVELLKKGLVVDHYETIGEED